MKIYLAGPLFTCAERLFNLQLKYWLEDLGHQVWLPQEKEPETRTAKDIFRLDVGGIDWAEIVVANMDCPDPDSGTCWECGYTYAKGKKVHLFRTDFRAAGDAALAPFNIMLSESAVSITMCPFIDRIDNLAGIIHKRIEYETRIEA